MPSRSSTRHAWARLPDDALLEVRFCDLGLSLERSPLLPLVERLYADLARRGIGFRPHCWIGEEWFTPDGVPGFAIPFFLAHPRLRRLERHMMGEVEGGNRGSFLRILRHEAGHAIDNAYRLRRRRRWRELFGRASLPYPNSYRPRPGSRRFVQHLGGWYAQSHPTEDFAETFAVWLQPASRWRRDYADWPALRKLEFVDELMREVRTLPAPVRTRLHIDSLVHDTRTLGEHYRVAQRRQASVRHPVEDQQLAGAFPAGAGGMRATTLLRRLAPALQASVTRRVGCSDYLARHVLGLAIRRAADLGLRVGADPERAARDAERVLVRLARATEKSAGRWLTL